MSPLRPAHFRSGLGRTCVMPALVAGLLALVVLRLLCAPHPWWLALGAGLLRFLHLLATAWARSGLRLDAEALTDVASGVTVRWSDVQEVSLSIENVPAPGGPLQACRLVTVRGPAGAEVRFGDLGPSFPGRAGASAEVVNSPASALVLAVVAERSGCAPLRPAAWTAPAAPASAPAAPAPPAHLAYRLRQAWGLVPLAFKAGPKALGVVLKLAKTINVGTAAVAVAAYSLVLSWQFAAALVFMIAVHECGHVFAMWRSGVAVKAIYFIPFMGGAAVPSEARLHQARAW